MGLFLRVELMLTHPPLRTYQIRLGYYLNQSKAAQLKCLTLLYEICQLTCRMKHQTPNGKRYQHYSDKGRAEIAKRAINFGITATIRHYATLYPTRGTIPVSSVATWKAKYLKELKIRVRENKIDLVIDKLPNKKRPPITTG